MQFKHISYKNDIVAILVAHRQLQWRRWRTGWSPRPAYTLLWSPEKPAIWLYTNSNTSNVGGYTSVRGVEYRWH